MMARTITWRPDTCECAILMQYEDDQPNLPPSPSFSRHCEFHKNSDAADVIKENQEKNKAVDTIARHLLVEHTFVRWDRTDEGLRYHVPGRDLGDYDKAILDKKLESQKLLGRMK